MVRQSTVLATKSRRSPIRASLGTARCIASTSVSFCTLGQAREVGPGQPSYRISANLKYTISDPCMEDRVRFDQLKRREFITLPGGSLSGLRGTRSARTQETSQVFISRKGPWGFDLSGMDLAIKPGDDFFVIVMVSGSNKQSYH